ncbi:MAG: PRC-barrel domain-containing protein [Chloroflexota bacterium]
MKVVTAMRIELGAKAVTSDGEEVGTVKHLVLDPTTTELRSAVVEHGLINREARLVPLELLVASSEERADLACSRDEFEQLPEYFESNFTSPPPGYTLPLSYPGGGLLWPLAFPAPAIQGSTESSAAVDEQSELLRQHDLENAIIDTDSDVMSRDGEKIGEVEHLAIDSVTGKPSRLVVRKGFLLHTSLELPIGAIASVDDGVVTLNLDKSEALHMATSPDH